MYPAGWTCRRIKRDGSVGHGSFVSTAVAGHLVGLQPLGGLRYRAWFYDVDLGAFEMTPSVPVLSRIAS